MVQPGDDVFCPPAAMKSTTGLKNNLIFIQKWKKPTVQISKCHHSGMVKASKNKIKTILRTFLEFCTIHIYIILN